MLIVSELATNAVMYGAGEFTVSVDALGTSLRVAISDPGGGVPGRRPPTADDPTGRGLVIVESLSERWGIVLSTSGPGKTVWCTLPID